MKWLFIAFMLFANFQLAYAETEESIKDQKIAFSLPINWVSTPKYNLIVTIPEGYQPIQPMSEWSKASTVLIEFIPKGQDSQNWTEIITLIKYIGKRFNAKQVNEHLKKSMLATVANSQIWQDKSSDELLYQVARFGLTYDLKGKKEVLGSVYYSGPLDCVGVQYTIRPTLNFTEADAKAKMARFFATEVKVDAQSTTI